MADPHNQLRSRTFPTEFNDLVAHARMGLRDDVRVVSISGYSPDAQTSPTQINPYDVTRDLTVPENFVAMEVKSDNASDVHWVAITGLDDQYQIKTERIKLDGTTPVALDGLWYRIYSIENASYFGIYEPVASTQGVVTVYPTGESGLPNDPATQAAMEGLASGVGMAGERSYEGSFTIPRGWQGFFLQAQAFPGKWDEVAISFQVRPFGGVFVGEAVINSFEVPTQVMGTGERFPELSDIRIMAKGLSSQGGDPILVRYSILLVKNV